MAYHINDSPLDIWSFHLTLNFVLHKILPERHYHGEYNVFLICGPRSDKTMYMFEVCYRETYFFVITR